MVTLGQACREAGLDAVLVAAELASSIGDEGPSSWAYFDGLAQLEADTHLHVDKENNVLFPRVVLLEDRRLS